MRDRFLTGESMTTMNRRVFAVLAALVVLALAAPAAVASSGFQVEELRLAPGHAAGRSAQAGGASPAPCSDAAYVKLGGKWLNGSYRWAFHAASTPAYLGRAAVGDILRKSFSNITSARNDCGLADRVSATHTYLNTTSVRPRCDRRDFKNVVGFQRLEWGVLAVTCYWLSNNRIVEADIQINSRERWALSLSSCVHDEVMLEATMTHEAGHVFGLGHVSERRHGRLTMSPLLNGPCQLSEATLGLGDVRGLEALY